MHRLFRALRFVQNDRVFYAVVMRAQDLLDQTDVDVWDADDPEDERGYQRALQPARVRSVAEYVASDSAILPLGGLLNARSPDSSRWGQRLRFEPDPDQPRGTIASGFLEIDDDALPLWIVDMQHRLAGIRHAIESLGRWDLRDFPLVVTIADGLSKLEEIEQFEIINTTQKKVPTDLARQLLAHQYQVGGIEALPDPRKEWEARGALIANWLNEKSVVLRGRIIPPNKSARDIPQGITKQTTFVSSLRPVLAAPFMQRMPEDKVAELIDIFWQAVSRVWPDAVKAGRRESLIIKSPGVYPLHMVLPEVVEVVRSRGETLDVESIHDAIAGWLALGDDYWDVGNTDTGATRYGSSGQSHIRVANELREYLPAIDYETYEQ